MTVSKSFVNIKKLTFDRKHDSINFFVSTGTQVQEIPSMRVFYRIPYATPLLGETQYTITAAGIVTALSGNILGKVVLPQQMDTSIVFQSGATTLLISADTLVTYPGQYSDINHITKTKD